MASETTTEIYVGIDYSLSSPCMCVYTHRPEKTEFENSQFYFLTNQKKMTGTWNNITGLIHSSYSTEQERYHNIACTFTSLIPADNTMIGIEDYSFGSTGRVFHIAENCGHLKHRIWSNRMKFETYAPSAIKKFATGKGNANKEKMYEAFLARTGVDLIKLMAANKIDSPITDIVDSFYISLYTMVKHLTRDDSNPSLYTVMQSLGPV